GTLKALSSYSSTMNTNNSKLDELQSAEKVHEAVEELIAPPTGPDADDRQAQTDLLLKKRLPQVRAAIDLYGAQLADTLQKKPDPDRGYQPMALLGDLRAGADDFQAAVQQANTTGFLAPNEPKLLTENAEVRRRHQRLAQAAGELRKAIYDSLYHSIDIARRRHRSSIVAASPPPVV